jgi:hypothetical protein
MKADISADLHDRAKRYSGARAQQGRVLTDADVNAALDILDVGHEELIRTLVCASGSPDDGFHVSGAASTTLALPGSGGNLSTIDLTFEAGSYVLGGKVLRLPDATTYLDQEEWLSLPLDTGNLPPAPVNGRTDLAFLEMVEHPVHAVEDREIGERALDADTTSRIRPRTRVRVFDDMPSDCSDAAEAMCQSLAGNGGKFSSDGAELLSNARLQVGFFNHEETGDPCAPQTVAGYLGAENHTVRIMLTRPGHFVWNYDHGGPYYRVQVDQGTGEIVFLTEPRDPVLFPRSNQVIEILPWDILLPNREKVAGALGHRAVLTGEYYPALRRIAYDGSLPADWQDWLDDLPATMDGIDDPEPRYFYARIWQAPEGGGTDQPTGAAVQLPGTGIELDFSGEGFAGDYWTASFRTAAPQQVLPYRLGMSGGTAPMGPRRFYATLATITWSGSNTATIHDCRNRFRSLCRVKGCCSYQVGDGHSSFGDFNDLAAAVAALPDDGGEICLLPGTHVANISLLNRRNILVHGCGLRSSVIPAEENTDPVFDFSGSRNITLRDFAIGTDTQLAVRGSSRSARPRLERLFISTENGAVSLDATAEASIVDCTFALRPRGEVLTSADLAFLRPLLYLQGKTLSVTGCEFVASKFKNRNTLSLGGLQIGGNSSNVLIRDCLIRGGNGNGITLGSIVTIVESDTGKRLVNRNTRWISISDDNCFQIEVPGTSPPATEPGKQTPRILSRGDISGLEIRHNRIENHGASGISVAWWFPAGEDVDDKSRDEIEIQDAVIADNSIRGCMALNLTAGLPVEVAFSTGFGGIVLSSTTDLQIENNDIRECGTKGRTPICGIFLRFASRSRIVANRIYDNGRPAKLTSPLLIGNIGGIVIPHVEGQSDGFGTRLRETPAVFIKDNTVISQEGRALELSGNGQMLVEGNAFTAHGNNSLLILILAITISSNKALAGNPHLVAAAQAQFRALMAQLTGSAVAIINTGMNPNLAAFFGYASLARKSIHNESGADVAGKPIVYDRQSAFQVVNAPQGPVSFNDNAVTFDALSPAVTLSLCSVAILSYDDVGMHDNQLSIDSGADLVLVNSIVLGLVSTRVQGNRFRERITAASISDGGFRLLSALTMGILNATENNLGTHCFLRLGLKKPRIVDVNGGETDLHLDTNRQVIAENLCSIYDQLSRSVGN